MCVPAGIAIWPTTLAVFVVLAPELLLPESLLLLVDDSDDPDDSLDALDTLKSSFDGCANVSCLPDCNDYPVPFMLESSCVV